jgi:hypothetical protein
MHGYDCENLKIVEKGVPKTIDEAIKSNPIFLRAIKDSNGPLWSMVDGYFQNGFNYIVHYKFYMAVFDYPNYGAYFIGVFI